MQPCGPSSPNGFENLLYALELVGKEGKVFDQIVGVLEVLQSNPGVGECQLVLDDVSLLREQGDKFILNFIPFFEQTRLDHFIDVGAGQRQPSLETSLNLREIV